VVVKTSVTPSSMRLHLEKPGRPKWLKKDVEKDTLIKRLEGVEYEFLVYSNVTKPLIDQNVCPFFLKTYGAAYNCNYSNILKLLATLPRPSDKLRRNMAAYLNKGQKRPAIDNVIMPSGFKSGDVDPEEELRFNMVVNEDLKNSVQDTQTVDSWIRDSRKQNVTQLKQSHWSYMFQVAVACYSLYCSDTAHNDLHIGNVFLQELPQTTEITYLVEDRVYIVKSDRKALVYDYDRAYCKALGNNPTLERPNPPLVSQNNYVANGKDFLKFMRFLYQNFVNSQDDILELFSDNDNIKDTIARVFDESSYLQEASTPLSQEWYSNLLPYPEIIRRIGALAGFRQPPKHTEVNFAVKKSMFDENGVLRKENNSSQALLLYQVNYLKNQITQLDKEIALEEARQFTASAAPL
jgi:uncharacterized small protein (DUF1192 family)